MKRSTPYAGNSQRAAGFVVNLLTSDPPQTRLYCRTGKFLPLYLGTGVLSNPRIQRSFGATMEISEWSAPTSRDETGFAGFSFQVHIGCAAHFRKRKL